jgi:2-methylcitrate dehydratase
LIDLAIELAPQVGDFGGVEEVVVDTSHHTHSVIGTGANDPQKFDPDASRETLDHSLMYILAVAFEDRAWHHERSYTVERAHRPSTVALWQKIRTREEAAWTARYHEPDTARQSFGGRLSIRLRDGRVVAGEKAVADAHPNGASPWAWDDYVRKFRDLTAGAIKPAERDRFLDDARRIAELGPAEIVRLNPALPAGAIDPTPTGEGIFDFGQRRPARA